MKNIILLSISVVIIVVSGCTENFQVQADPINCALTTKYVINSANYDPNYEILVIEITNKGKNSIYDFSILLENGENMEVIEKNEISSDIMINKYEPLEKDETVNLRVSLSNILTLNEESTILVKNEACKKVTAQTTTINTNYVAIVGS